MKGQGRVELWLNDKAFTLRRRWSCGCSMWLARDHTRLYLACRNPHSEETIIRICRELRAGKALAFRSGFHLNP